MADKDMNVSDEAIANLSDQIASVDKKVDRRFNAVNRTINTFKREVTDSLKVFDHYMTDQEGYDRGMKEAKGSRGAGFNASPDLIKIILILATILAGALGVTQLQ